MKLLKFENFLEKHEQTWQSDDKTYYFEQEHKKWQNSVNVLETSLFEKFTNKKIKIECYVENREFVVSVNIEKKGNKSEFSFWFYPERNLVLWKSPWKMFDINLNRVNLAFKEIEIKKFIVSL